METILARPDDPRLAPGLFLAAPTLCVLREDGSLWPADAMPQPDPAPDPAPVAAPAKASKTATPTTPAVDAAPAQ